jgi:hypothetical protein
VDKKFFAHQSLLELEKTPEIPGIWTKPQISEFCTGNPYMQKKFNYHF